MKLPWKAWAEGQRERAENEAKYQAALADLRKVEDEILARRHRGQVIEATTEVLGRRFWAEHLLVCTTTAVYDVYFDGEGSWSLAPQMTWGRIEGEIRAVVPVADV